MLVMRIPECHLSAFVVVRVGFQSGSESGHDTNWALSFVHCANLFF